MIVSEWSEWLADRAGSGTLSPDLVTRELRLVLDGLIEMLGPLKREAKVVWQHVMEHYGRTAAMRGLAAGEVVEEIQHLRFLLIRHVGASVAAMRPRRAVAVFLRLNGIVDRGIALAVVGYTDALVASLLMTDRSTLALTETSGDDVDRLLTALEAELANISSRR